MPSYADEYAALHPELQGNNTGPVRLTISRGDSVRGPNGDYTFLEKWDQEEIMDVEVAGSIEAEASTSRTAARDPDKRLIDTIRERMSTGRSLGASIQRYSLLVLDTNVLLSSLPFLMTLFSQCLSRNAFALSSTNIAPSPIALIIPQIVLSELDNLKTSSKGNVGPAARAANHWVLFALQTQKRQMYDAVEGDTVRRERITERSWVLHVENSAHASALEQFEGSRSTLMSPLGIEEKLSYVADSQITQTPDEEIVRLCISLNKQAGLDVFFCSDDTNARTRAEVEGLPTFSFLELTKDVYGNEKAKEEGLGQLARDLIEQWQAQVQSSTDQLGMNSRMEEDERVMDDNRNLSTEFGQSGSRSKINETGRTTQHSKHAFEHHPSPQHHTDLDNTTMLKRLSPSTSRHTHNSRPNQFGYSGNTHNHQYPDDRSISSSMWAVQQRH